MAIRLDEMETANNREAEGSTFTRRTVDMSEAFMEDEYDPSNGGTEPAQPSPEELEGGFPLKEDQLMRLVRSAYSQGSDYQQQILQPRWIAALNAFNNKHSSDSKYSSSRFRGRSRLFRPKTRATARKKQAEAAAALFSTADALIVRAADESDDKQRAGAELIASLLRFRLDRSNENSGIPWFQISMGAHLSAQQSAVCISKQYWEYRREFLGFEEQPIEEQIPPPLVPLVGASTLVVGTRRVPKYRTVRDRPRIELMPPEDVIRDPAAAWEDQTQDSAYLILRFPMTVEAARTFLRQASEKSRVQFVDVSDAALAAAAGGASDPNNAASVRRARETSGADRFSDFAVDNAYKQVWLHENFFRIEGRDYCFWTLNQDRLISEVIPVEEAYPEQGGARPIVIGVGALEPFKIDPMSPVESWQELQREINDLVNLRLDTLKQTIAPLAKVRRGRSVDIRAIQNRTPDTVVYMQDMGDVEFDRPGQVAGESYIEMEKLNADFDDQAGNFSTGSVQTNRQLGETVGGMQMMMSNANALGEFDLRVWVETWVEPVLRQIVKLEQYYESDENVVAISAKRAKLMPRFGISQITDDILTSQVAISVDVGIGSSDPLISLQKFEKASQVALGLLGPAAQARLKQDAIINEVYGKAGYKDAADRFFNPAEEGDQRIQQMQAAMQEMQQALQEAEKALQDKSEEIKSRERIADGNNATQREVAKMATLKDLAGKELNNRAKTEQMREQLQASSQSERENYEREQAKAAQEEEARMREREENESKARDDGQEILQGLTELATQLANAIQQGNHVLAQGIQEGNQAIADGMQQGNAAVIEAINQNGQMQSDSIAQSNSQIVAALGRPKRVKRGPDGFLSEIESYDPSTDEQPMS
jgi:hypothetical protein